jgi:hypothetical protein
MIPSSAAQPIIRALKKKRGRKKGVCKLRNEEAREREREREKGSAEGRIDVY